MYLKHKIYDDDTGMIMSVSLIPTNHEILVEYGVHFNANFVKPEIGNEFGWSVVNFQTWLLHGGLVGSVWSFKISGIWE